MTPGVPRKELARLQQTLLRAVLLDEPLPDGQAARLADLGWILRGETIRLLDEHLAGPVTVTGAPKPITVVSAAEVARAAHADGECAYLAFLPPEVDDAGDVWLTIEGRVAFAQPERHPLGLSRLQVQLRESHGRWDVAGAPRGLAG